MKDRRKSKGKGNGKDPFAQFDSIEHGVDQLRGKGYETYKALVAEGYGRAEALSAVQRFEKPNW